MNKITYVLTIVFACVMNVLSTVTALTKGGAIAIAVFSISLLGTAGLLVILFMKMDFAKERLVKRNNDLKQVQESAADMLSVLFDYMNKSSSCIRAHLKGGCVLTRNEFLDMREMHINPGEILHEFDSKSFIETVRSAGNGNGSISRLVENVGDVIWRSVR